MISTKNLVLEFGQNNVSSEVAPLVNSLSCLQILPLYSAHSRFWNRAFVLPLCMLVTLSHPMIVKQSCLAEEEDLKTAGQL